MSTALALLVDQALGSLSCAQKISTTSAEKSAKISLDCAPGDHICIRHPPTLKSIHGNLPPETPGQVGRSLKLGKTEIGFSPIFICNPLCLVALQSGFLTLGYMNPFDLSSTTHEVFSDVRLYAVRCLLPV